MTPRRPLDDYSLGGKVIVACSGSIMGLDQRVARSKCAGKERKWLLRTSRQRA